MQTWIHTGLIAPLKALNVESRSLQSRTAREGDEKGEVNLHCPVVNAPSRFVFHFKFSKLSERNVTLIKLEGTICEALHSSCTVSYTTHLMSRSITVVRCIFHGHTRGWTEGRTYLFFSCDMNWDRGFLTMATVFSISPCRSGRITFFVHRIPTCPCEGI